MKSLKTNFFIHLHQVYNALRSHSGIHLTMMIGVGVLLGIFGAEAYAAGGAMPWEGHICSVAKSLSTTTAKAVAVIAVVFCGLLLAFGELGGIFKTFIGLLMGVSMAIMAGQWVGFIDGSGGSFC